ncbi:alpha-hydroxy-acid oxidizing protein, partial [Brenneria sp. 4F2]|nr:alpha-hydroxy-acid oxidizing protein [Brenneria bubanii]
DEFSLRENHYAYSRVFFRPRILQDIEPENIDTSTTFLGSKADLPIYVSGFAGSRLAHPLGEKNLQAAAYKYNMMQMVP